jgi:hypothetical protein
MQQGKARSNGKGTMQRGKGWAKQQGANIGVTYIVSNSNNKRNTIQGAKDRLKIYYNSLIINVLDGGASET